MSTSSPFADLIEGARDRRGLGPLLEALGFEPAADVVPAEARGAYGLGEAPDVEELVVAGRSGSLDALLMETAPGTGTDRVAWLARRVRARNPARIHLFVAAGPGYRRLVLGTFGLDDAFRHLTLERRRIRPSDLEALEEMAPANGEAGLELAIRQARALDRSRVTRSFFRDFRGRRSAIAEAWTGLPDDAQRDRAQLALLFLSRLTFLYFLQRRGVLAGEDRYLARLFGSWDGGGPPRRTFFQARLQPLFFGALNRRPEDRDALARQLGDLPYLNGGLFERHALERRYPELDLPDPEVQACFDDLLERYRFTTREAGEGAGFGVDPEVLGRVFEGLMAPGTRGDTGSFYTPAPVVNRVVREAVATYVAGTVPGTNGEAAATAAAVVDGRGEAVPASLRYRVRGRLERVRVLDPACGSGAFLLGALQQLTESITAMGAGNDPPAPGDVRREIVARGLHGVDLLDDAALLCSLRLWLALSADDDRVRPLPNLDRRIRQGDALVDPLELGLLSAGRDLHWHPQRDPEIREAFRQLAPAAREYVGSGPEERAETRKRVQRLETRLARGWVRGLMGARKRQLARLEARAADRDLFGHVPEAARQAASDAVGVRDRLKELDRIAHRLDDRGSLPFFSFGIHFAEAVGADGGFDLVISNPPWVRSHRWPDHLRAHAHRFEVCRSPAWAAAAELTGSPVGGGAQVDLSLLFIERGVRLLAPGGVLAVLVSAKMFRALYGGAARRMLLRDLEFALIEDHALDQRAIFKADAFAGVLVGRKTAASPASPVEVRVRMTRRDVDPLEFRVDPGDLPLFPDDPASPWLLAPPAVRAVFRRMQAAGPPLGRHPDLRVRRGVMTGANDVLVCARVEPKLGGLAEMEAEGAARARRSGGTAREAARFRAVVEADGVRPLVRGADIDAFRYQAGGHVIWCHDGRGEPAEPGPRMAAYLERHRERLIARAGYRAGRPLGMVFRLGPETLGPKVAWHDLSDTLRAVALPHTVPFDGSPRELVPLNTVYFLPTPDDHRAVLLAGLLNSLPVRTFARAVAERAKDARFRFFAWTVSALPLPPAFGTTPTDGGGGETVEAIRRISATAHAAGGIGPADQRRLDRAVGALYGLDAGHLEALDQFHRWLTGDDT